MLGELHLGRALLAGIVALALQIGVNFANDYSDGVRGTDAARSGPMRLTASGAVPPRTVKLLAFAFFGLAGVVGLLLLALSGTWFFLVPGILAVIAAWFYTGGKHPYGYMGLGELFVFLFFGLLATIGTTYTQALSAPASVWWTATSMGLISCALLMINNVRDIPTDRVAGKMTLAARLGDRPARALYVVELLAAVAAMIPAAGLWALLGLIGVASLSMRTLSGRTGRDLIPVLRDTGLFQVAMAILLVIVAALK